MKTCFEDVVMYDKARTAEYGIKYQDTKILKREATLEY